MKIPDILSAGLTGETTADHIEAQAPVYYQTVKNRPRPPKKPKYPFGDMEVDDSVDIPLDPVIARNERDPAKQVKQRVKTMRNRLHQAIHKVKRTALPGSEFEIYAQTDCLRVWRTA